jgi:hypothetical protein
MQTYQSKKGRKSRVSQKRSFDLFKIKKKHGSILITIIYDNKNQNNKSP